MSEVLQVFEDLFSTLSTTTVKLFGDNSARVPLSAICFGLPLIGAFVALATPWARDSDGGDDE